jgi:hypothetical protein
MIPFPYQGVRAAVRGDSLPLSGLPSWCSVVSVVLVGGWGDGVRVGRGVCGGCCGWGVVSGVCRGFFRGFFLCVLRVSGGFSGFLLV